MPVDLLTSLIFFSGFMVAYFLSRGQTRLLICLLASYIFISFWDWRFLVILFLATLIDYIIALEISKESNLPKRRLWLILSLILSLALLGFFKYMNFFSANLHVLLNRLGLNVQLPALELILPLGISFYTFQKIGYVVDVYRKTIDAETNLVRFASFIAFFPKVISGPIVMAKDFLPQLQKLPSFNWSRMLDGLELILWGVFKKFVIANSLGLIVDVCFAAPEAHTSLSLMIAALFYTFQIYCDFSGYSDMAIGFAKILGFDLGRNFNCPYFATSFRDFWTRWHISLSTWLRVYLYIPLGGNRHGFLRTSLNLFITMLLCGLWHGANWTFIVWGALHGLFIVSQRILSQLKEKISVMHWMPLALSRSISIVTVFIMVCFAWIFFRATTITEAIQIIQGIIRFDNLSFSAVQSSFWVIKGLILIGFLVAIEAADVLTNVSKLIHYRPVYRFVLNAFLIWAIPMLGVFSDKAFIYSQF